MTDGIAPAATARTLSILGILATGKMLNLRDDGLLAMRGDMSIGFVWREGSDAEYPIWIPLTLKEVNRLLSKHGFTADGRRPILDA